MALTIGNPTYLTAGPTKTGQVVAPNEQSNLEEALNTVFTVTLDGATTSGTFNLIDGTNAPFCSPGTTTAVAPSAVWMQVIGGTQLAAAPVGITATGTITTTTCKFYISGAGTNANTLVIAAEIVR